MLEGGTDAGCWWAARMEGSWCGEFICNIDRYVEGTRVTNGGIGLPGIPKGDNGTGLLVPARVSRI